jgi:hypothetical protein
MLVREHRPYVWFERILGDDMSGVKHEKAGGCLGPQLWRPALAVRGLVRVRHEKRSVSRLQSGYRLNRPRSSD